MIKVIIKLTRKLVRAEDEIKRLKKALETNQNNARSMVDNLNRTNRKICRADAVKEALRELLDALAEQSRWTPAVGDAVRKARSIECVGRPLPSSAELDPPQCADCGEVTTNEVDGGQHECRPQQPRRGDYFVATAASEDDRGAPVVRTGLREYTTAYREAGEIADAYKVKAFVCGFVNAVLPRNS